MMVGLMSVGVGAVGFVIDVVVRGCCGGGEGVGFCYVIFGFVYVEVGIVVLVVGGGFHCVYFCVVG